MVKNPSVSAGDLRGAASIPGQEDPLEKEMATHSSENPVDSGAWQAVIHRVAQSQKLLK